VPKMVGEMTFRRFEDIRAWQAARILTAAVYAASKQRPFSRDFGLRDQIRRANVSIMANIAEGFVHRSDREFVRYLFAAKASTAEVQSHLYVALD
jgi:four helix bundle protein